MNTAQTSDAPPATADQPPPAYQDEPALTLYRDGYANLNGEATRALPSQASELTLWPPTSRRRQWLLLPAAGELAGEIKLVGRADRGHLRFRAPALAVALFAALPDAQPSLRLQLEPAGTGWRLVAQNPCTKSGGEDSRPGP